MKTNYTAMRFYSKVDEIKTTAELYSSNIKLCNYDMKRFSPKIKVSHYFQWLLVMVIPGFRLVSENLITYSLHRLLQTLKMTVSMPVFLESEIWHLEVLNVSSICY